MMARLGWQNPFIENECEIKGIEKAPIGTNIYETYAQCNEDLIIEGILRAQFHRMGRSLQSMRYAELGANHPIQTSSTYLFYKLYGARGVLVEANPILADKLKTIRPGDVIVDCAISTSTNDTITFYIHEMNELSSISTDHISQFKKFGGTENIVDKIVCRNMHINDFMKAYDLSNLDYLSIDIEGLDIEVIMALDTVFQPLIIQCEYGDQLAKFTEIMGGKGYRLVAMTDLNAIFIRANII